MASTEITNLQKVVCINLDIHMWSGRAKLREADIKIIEGELPPTNLASLGSKKIINPEDISGFEALKKEAERECAKVGVKFLGGYAVPESKASDLAAVLDEIGERFDAQKEALLSVYDAKINDWVKAHPGWETVIRTATIDRDEVDAKLSYGWQAYRIIEAAEGEANAGQNPLNKGLATTAKGLAGQLYREIAQAAGTIMEKSLMGKDRTTQKVLSPVRTIRSKLLGLSFIDSRVKPLIETIDHALEMLPQAGHIDGMALIALHGLVFILSDESRMVQHSEMILAGTPVAESFVVSVPQIKQEPEAVATAPAAVEIPVTTTEALPVSATVAVQEQLPLAAIPPVAKRGPVKGLFS